MKKLILTLLLPLLFLTGCLSKEESNDLIIEQQLDDIYEMNDQLVNLELSKEKILAEIKGIKTENDIDRYFVTMSIKQSHLSLDITEHLKDEMNELEIQIPVDEEYYHTVKVGDVIDDSFRAGSFISKGSMGSWDITISGKSIE